MTDLPRSFVTKHNSYYLGERAKKHLTRLATPGSQYLLQLLKGGRFGPKWADGQGMRALDAGCGSGYDCVTLALLGYEVYGFEITKEIADHAARNTGDMGVKAEIRVGRNEQIPYPDDFFDLLVSKSVIHYAQSREIMRRSVGEYRRVLKPGGLLFLVTNHPDNWLFEGAEPVGGQMYRLHFKDDYRNGELMFRFRDTDDLRSYFEPYFRDIRVGENRVEYFDKTLKHYVLKGFKR